MAPLYLCAPTACCVVPRLTGTSDALLCVWHGWLGAEDVAIAFGYNNIKKKIPKTPTVGRQLPINAVCVRLPRVLSPACVVAPVPTCVILSLVL